METRRLGRTGLAVGAIGLGTEYLDDQPRDVVTAVVHEAIERGVNYIEALFAFAGYRDNLGAALKGYRDRVFIAGHLGCAETDGQYRRTRDPRENEHLFHDLLTRLHTDHVDVLIIQFVDEEEDYRQAMGPGGSLELAHRLQHEGKARFVGLSGHQTPVALQAVQSGQFDVLMFPVNLGQQAAPEVEALFHACARQGIGLVAMKPFAGGELLQPQNPKHATPVQCLAYVLSRVGVSTTVPGVKSVEELRAALAYLEAPDSEKDFQPALAGLEGLSGSCVYCNHCLPCPSGIDVGRTTRLLVTAQYGLSADLLAAYRALPALASECTECGACVQRCPFGVDVVENMQRAAQLFDVYPRSET